MISNLDLHRNSRLLNLKFIFKDNLNQKLREAENFERDSLTQEENAKLQVDEAEKQKLLAEEKLQECITREGRVFEDLQKLKVSTTATGTF